MNLSDFQKGDRVTRIPNKNHPDSEHGIVSSIGSKFVFVVYYNKRGFVTAQATDPNDLVKT